MTPLRRMLYLDSRVWLPDDLLVKADKMTMAHAIELRVPFLDHELMEHAWSLPDHLKIHNGVGKALLRKAARGRVPQAILDRPKMGFGTPTAAWLRGGMRELAARRAHRQPLAGARALRSRLRARAPGAPCRPAPTCRPSCGRWSCSSCGTRTSPRAHARADPEVA